MRGKQDSHVKVCVDVPAHTLVSVALLLDWPVSKLTVKCTLLLRYLVSTANKGQETQRVTIACNNTSVFCYS